MKRFFIEIVSLLVVCAVVSGCQATPNEVAVINKEDALEEKLQTVGSGDGADSSGVETVSIEDGSFTNQFDGEHWFYEKNFPSGIQLVIDADIENAERSSAPVITVVNDPFAEGEPIRRVVSALCPDESMIYDAFKSLGEGADLSSSLTKEQCEKGILEQRQYIFDMENMKKEYADDRVKLAEIDLSILNAKDTLAYLEKTYETAPNEQRIEADFTLTHLGDGNDQISLWTELAGGQRLGFSLANWDVNTSFYHSVEGSSRGRWYEDGKGPEIVYRSYKQIENDAMLAAYKKQLDTIVANMGIDYMTLDVVAYGKEYNDMNFFYTRAYGDLNESYVSDALGTVVHQEEGVSYIELWESEYLEFAYVEGDLFVAWLNKARMESVVEENAAILPWSTIQQTAEKQFEYMLKALEVQPPYSLAPIHINRIELGFAKVMKKDSPTEYLLIPAWSFVGYQENDEMDNHMGIAEAAYCYLTINAIDGSVIDRNLMY